jgi:hypothetical protein
MHENRSDNPITGRQSGGGVVDEVGLSQSCKSGTLVRSYILVHVWWKPGMESFFLHHVAPASSALAADGQANLRGPTLCTALQARLTFFFACRILKALASHLWEEAYPKTF